MVEVLQTGLGRAVGRVDVGAHDAHHPPHLREGPATGLLDRQERFALALLLGTEQAAHAARLDRHDAHGVGDDVVQLAGDAAAFLGDRLAGEGVALRLELRRPDRGGCGSSGRGSR